MGCEVDVKVCRDDLCSLETLPVGGFWDLSERGLLIQCGDDG